jgi:hypothetical protein
MNNRYRIGTAGFNFNKAAASHRIRPNRNVKPIANSNYRTFLDQFSGHAMTYPAYIIIDQPHISMASAGGGKRV